MILLYLLNELLLSLATFLEAEKDINSLCRTDRRLHALLNPYLYRHNSLDSGSSALQWASEHGNQGTARISIQEGASINATDSSGRTPLYWAALNGHEAVVKLLLETGQVAVDSKDYHGQTPLSWAARNGREGW
jgi:ankyrin repeat protein